MTSWYNVSELDATNGTKSRPESGPSWDHVGTKSKTSWEQVTEQVTEQVRSLVICLEDKSLGRREAMQRVGISSRPTFVYDYLQPAIQAGLVEMTQPASPKSPTQKYRLTPKGRTYLTKEVAKHDQ